MLIRPGRSWRHNPTYASELSRLGEAEVRAFDGTRILDVLGIEVDGVDIAAGVGEAPLCAMVDGLVQAALHLARGEPAAQATVGPGPAQVVLEPRGGGEEVWLTLLSLRAPARVLAGGLLVDAAKLRAAALGAAQRVLADLLDLGPALRGSPFVRRLTRDLRELARVRPARPTPWPPEKNAQAGFVARSAASASGSAVRLEVRVPAPSAARLAFRALCPHAPLAPLLGPGSLALRFGTAAPERKGAGTSLASQSLAPQSLAPQASRERRAGAAGPLAGAASASASPSGLALEAPPYLALRELLRSAEELVRAFESGERTHVLRWGPLSLRCDLTRDELRAEGLRDPVRAPPLALAGACATAARAFAKRALALSPDAKTGRKVKAARAGAESACDAPLVSLSAAATALLKHCRDLASGDLRRAPESVRAPPLPLPQPAPAQPRLRGSVRRLVHRLAFELQVGPIGETGLHAFPAAGTAVLQGAAGLFAVELASAARTWHLAGVAPSSAAVARADPSDLYALAGDALLRLEPATGEQRFRRVLRGAGARIFAVPGGCAVTLVSGGVALVRAGGALAFRARLAGEPLHVLGAEGVLVAQLPGGQLVGLDATEASLGAELWRRRIGVRAGRASVAPGGGQVLAAACDARGASRVISLALATGDTLWEHPLPKAQSAPAPAIATSQLGAASTLGASAQEYDDAHATPGLDTRRAPAGDGLPEPVFFGEAGELCALLAGRGLLACRVSDGATAFARELPWGPHGRLHALDEAAAHALLALGPGAATVCLDARGQPRWSRPALSPKLAPPQAPAQQGTALLLAESAVELVDAETGRTLARPAMADADATALLPDLSVLLHLRDGTLAQMGLATHLSLV